MRNISFFLTEKQFIAGTKTVTRRLAWRNLRPGTRLVAVRKTQGLKRGEHPVVLGTIEVVSAWQEPLNRITPEDVVREGFPGLSVWDFITMFCTHMKCMPEAEVTRIEFRKVASAEEPGEVVAGPPRYGRGSLLAMLWGVGSAPLVILRFDYARRQYVGMVWVHNLRRFFKVLRMVDEINARLADGYDHPHFEEARVAWHELARTSSDPVETLESGSSAHSVAV